MAARRSDASLIQADANRRHLTARDEWSPEAIESEEAPRAVRDYLEHLDHEAFGASTDVAPKFTSNSDPSSQWTAAHHGAAEAGYSKNELAGLKDHIDQMEAAIDQNDRHLWSENDEALHNELVKLGGNSHVKDIVNNFNIVCAERET